MAYSCFEMIPLNQTIVLANMERELNRLNDALQEIRKKPYLYKERSFIEKEKERIHSLTQNFLESMSMPKTEEITFDALEINTLFVDEAHNYKNIPIHTKMKNLNGINTKGSSKCLDLLHKVRHVQNTTGRIQRLQKAFG
jgi:N12 class adenine-specific DNA methylase